MSNLFWSGEPGQRLDFGPFDTTGIIDGTTIDSVTVRVRANEGPEVDWDAQIIDASLREVSASVVTDGLLNATPGIYRFSCFFWSAPGVLAFAGDQQTVRFTERSVDFPTLLPPYFGWEARVAAAEAAADAAEDSAAAAAGRTYEAVRAVLTTGAKTGLTVDGVTLTAGQRVLASEAGTTAGIYLAAAGAWTRATDMAAGDVLSLGGIVPVLEGTAANVGLWLMTSPTTGTPVAGTTAIEWQVASATDVLATVAYSSAVDLTTSGRMIYAGENSGVFLAGLSATSGFVDGTQAVWFVPAGTALSVVIAEAIDPGGALASLFNIAEDFTLFVTATSATTFVASAQSRPPIGAVVPTFAATVLSTDLDRLIITGSEPLQYPVSASDPDGDTTGVSLGGTMAVARTLGAVVSGNGTTSIVQALSGDLDVTDLATVVAASGRQLRAMSGPRVAVASVPITITYADFDWLGTVTSPTLDLIASAGIGVADGAAVASWTDQSVDAWVFNEATNRPLYDADGAKGQPAVAFDGVNDYLTSAVATIADIAGGSGSAAFELIWMGKVVALGAGDTPLFCASFTDFDRCSLLLDFSGGQYRVKCKVLDSGGFRQATVNIGASLPANGVVASMRISGGLLYAGYNGTEGTGAACDGINSGIDPNIWRIGRGLTTADYANVRAARIVAKANGTKTTAAYSAFVAKYT